MDKITNEELLSLCRKRYTYVDGHLISNETNCSLGCHDRAGHLKTVIYYNGDRINFAVHRLIFLMHYEYLPDFIDHINGKRDDNRIENLRAVTTSENNRNRPVSKHSTSGAKGVIYNKNSTKPWNARIRYDNKIHSLGYYHTIEEASAVYQRAAEHYFGEHAYHISRSDA